jgi:hypothetical protein
MPDQPQDITVTMVGPFATNDLAELVEFIRDLDSHYPDRGYAIVINDPNATLGAAEKTLREIIPPLPGRKSSFAVFRNRPRQ